MENLHPTPEIGQLAKALHAGNAQEWTEQTGLIVDKEPNPVTKDFSYGLMFSDGHMTWGGKNSLDIIGWPE